MGKTSLVLNMAANVASPQQLESAHDPNERWEEPGYGVVVFSLEMPREQIVNRMLCSEAKRRREPRAHGDAHAEPTGAS